MTVQDHLMEPDLAEADRLIADLAALLDAGLVVVHEHVIGPARYGPTCGEDEWTPVSSRWATDAPTLGLIRSRRPTDLDD